MNKNAEMLEKTDVKKLLIKLAVPAFIGMAANALYNLIDTIFVGRGVGTLAIGGLGLAFPIQMIVLAFGLMIGMGSAAIFSLAFGEKSKEKMDEAVNTALQLNLILSIVISILTYLFLDKLLVFFGASSDNINYAKEYLTIVLFGFLPQSMSMILNNLTRAEGRAKVAMISMALGTILNIVLDPIFIFVFHMGIAGAAIATVISQIIGFIYIFSESVSPKSIMQIHFNKIQLRVKCILRIMAIGFPSFLRNAIGAIITITIMNLILKYAGTDAGMYQSIFSTMNRVLSFLFLPSFGVIQGLAPIVGFSYGAKLYQRLRESIRFAMWIIFVYYLLAFTGVQLFTTTIFRIFDSSGTDQFTTLGSSALRVLSLGFPLIGFQVLVSSVYQSEGHPVRATLIALSRQLLLFLPFVYILSYFFGLEGIWFSFPAADILTGLASVIFYFVEMKRIHQLELNSIIE